MADHRMKNRLVSFDHKKLIRKELKQKMRIFYKNISLEERITLFDF
jgi:hypothetical protein